MSAGRVDLRALVLGAAISALLSTGLAVAGARFGGGGGGPTAASISEGLGEFFGAAVGLFVGGAGTAVLARQGSRALAGVLAAMLAYALVLVPAFVATRPSDVTAADTLAFALAALIVFAPMAIVGAALGELLATR